MPRTPSDTPKKHSSFAWAGVIFLSVGIFATVLVTNVLGSSKPLAQMSVPPPAGGTSGFLADIFTGVYGATKQVLCNAVDGCLGLPPPGTPNPGYVPYECTFDEDCHAKTGEKCSFCARIMYTTPMGHEVPDSRFPPKCIVRTCPENLIMSAACTCVCLPEKQPKCPVGQFRNPKTCQCEAPECKSNAECQKDASGNPKQTDPAYNNCNWCKDGFCTVEYTCTYKKGCVAGTGTPKCIEGEGKCGNSSHCKYCEKCSAGVCVAKNECPAGKHCAEVSFDPAGNAVFGQCVECTNDEQCNSPSEGGRTCNVCLKNKCFIPEYCSSTGEKNPISPGEGTSGQIPSFSGVTGGTGNPPSGTVGGTTGQSPSFAGTSGGTAGTPTFSGGTDDHQTTDTSGPITFLDVEEGTPLNDALNVLTSKGVVTGYSDNRFHGGSPVSRAEFATMLLRARGINLQNSIVSTSVAPDVPRGVWFEPALFAAKNMKIMSGYPDGTMGPERLVTRAESLKMLAVAFQVPMTTTHSYTDVSEGSWENGPASVAWRFELMEGSEFRPAEPISRKEAAITIYKFLRELL